jgi:hypothetical protein
MLISFSALTKEAVLKKAVTTRYRGFVCALSEPGKDDARRVFTAPDDNGNAYISQGLATREIASLFASVLSAPRSPVP